MTLGDKVKRLFATGLVVAGMWFASVMPAYGAEKPGVKQEQKQVEEFEKKVVINGLNDAVCSGIGLVVKDLNKDGYQDILLATPNGLRIIYNDGNGNFKEPKEIGRGLNDAVESGIGLVAEDYNKDGHLDILLATPNGLRIIYNDGKGSFKEPKEIGRGLNDAVESGIGLVSEDYNKDGYLDILLATPNGLRIIYNDGNGNFEEPKKIGRGLNDAVCSGIGLVSEDYNKDGHLDILLATPNGLRIIYSDGNGDFKEPKEIGRGLGDAVKSGIGLVAEDYNNDGHLDILLATPNGLRIIYNDGNGSFKEPKEIGRGLNDAVRSGIGLVLSDFNNDNKKEIALATPNGLCLIYQK